jgi:glutamate/tyrosine decarboxylase-like PLP-dependent enzyme
MFTYEVAPVYNLIEEVTLTKMRHIIGWTEPGDGLFNPGGSVSNLYAVQIAKHHFFPRTKTEGLFNMPKLVVFTSSHVRIKINIFLH